MADPKDTRVLDMGDPTKGPVDGAGAQVMYAKMVGSQKFMQRPISNRTALIAGGVVVVLAVNESYGAYRHRKGKNWPTLFNGYKGQVVMKLGAPEFGALMDAVNGKGPQQPSNVTPLPFSIPGTGT